MRESARQKEEIWREKEKEKDLQNEDLENWLQHVEREAKKLVLDVEWEEDMRKKETEKLAASEKCVAELRAEVAALQDQRSETAEMKRELAERKLAIKSLERQVQKATDDSKDKIEVRQAEKKNVPPKHFRDVSRNVSETFLNVFAGTNRAGHFSPAKRNPSCCLHCLLSPHRPTAVISHL